MIQINKLPTSPHRLKDVTFEEDTSQLNKKKVDNIGRQQRMIHIDTRQYTKSFGMAG